MTPEEAFREELSSLGSALPMARKRERQRNREARQRYEKMVIAKQFADAILVLTEGVREHRLSGQSESEYAEMLAAKYLPFLYEPIRRIFKSGVTSGMFWEVAKNSSDPDNICLLVVTGLLWCFGADRELRSYNQREAIRERRRMA